MGELPLFDLRACCPQGLREPLDPTAAEGFARILKALGDPGRLRLLSLIRSAGEACACDLVEPLGLSQPTVSHHLKVLAGAGLVHRQRRGQWVWYRADEERLNDVARALGPA